MADFSHLTEYLDSLSQRFGIPGCGCAVAVDGEVVYRHFTGFRDEEERLPVTENTTWWIYSATKLFTCVAALQLYEQGKLELSDPVSKFLPEFASLTVRGADGIMHPSEETLTIRHLLTMTGGLDYDLERPALRRALENGAESTRELVAALAEDPLKFEPGSHFLYSLCHDVLGAVIEVASGQLLSDYVREHITEPLGMRDTTFRPADAQLARLAKQYIHLDEKGTHRPMGQGNRFRLSDSYDSGGAGLLSTVDDYVQLVSALAMGGGSILKPETVKLMHTPALNETQRAEFCSLRTAVRPYSYGLGVRTMVDNAGITAPVGEFGWDGAAGAYALADTTNRVALFYAQAVCQSYITYQYLHPGLRDALYQSLEDYHV